MMRTFLVSWIVMIAGVWTPATFGDEPAGAQSIAPPAPLSPDEPLAAEFSLERAAQALDAGALHWLQDHACIACHTVQSYMMARHALDQVAPRPVGVRKFFEEVADGKRDGMPNYTCGDVDGAAAIDVAVALALDDRGTTGRLHPLTRRALDRMWELQRQDGAWQWPFRDTPPIKTSEHYGTTLAAIAAGMAPDGYAETPAAREGLARIRQYVERNPPTTLHEQTMLLWAAAYTTGLMSSDDRAAALAKLLAAQRPDGGWSIASLIDNTNATQDASPERVAQARLEPGYGTKVLAYIGRDKTHFSSLASDGYATGLAIYVARQGGVPADDDRLGRGVAWLKTNQRASGRWFTPSQSWHTQHYISNAGTGYAALAIAACQPR